MDDRITLLLSGAPGTGKTTLQRLAPAYLRSRLGPTMAAGTDEMYTLTDPDWSFTGEDQARNSALARKCCAAVALTGFRHGVRTAVIAGNALFEPGWVNEIIPELLPVSGVYHFTLDASVDTVVERVKDREAAYQHPPEWHDSWLAHVRTFVRDWTYVIDTGRLTPEEILDLIVGRVLRGQGRITGPVG
jgi:hypothetical protein